MRRARILSICVTAAFAAGAVAATGAAAAPPEFTPPFPNPFKSTSKATTLETIGKRKLTCLTDTDAGEATGPATVALKIKFKGCTTNAVAGVKCQSPNGLPGEIITEQLIGTLGYVNREPKEVGLDLSTPTGGPMAVFFCGEDFTGEVVGSVIGRITPLNKLVKPAEHFTLAFKQLAGHQAIRMFLGGPVDVPLAKFGAGPLEEAGLASTDVIKFAAPTRIVA